MINENANIALIKAYAKASNLFHEKITPNLPEEIQKELELCESFSCMSVGKKPNVILSVNGKEFDITEWYVPGITIFDVYEYN